MAKRRTDDWQIDEWDESLDAAASVRKDPSAPVTSENWNAADDWGDPLPPSKPPKKTNSTWKWIAVIGSIAAVLVLVILLVAGSNPGPGSGTVTVTEIPAVTDTPEPVITKVPDPATEALTEEPTKAPTNPPTEAPTKEPTAAPTDPPAPEPLTINCAWYGEDMRYYYHQLSEKEQKCFTLLYNGILDFRKSIRIADAGCSLEELDRVYYALMFDAPELFQIIGSYSYYTFGETISSVENNYRLEQDEYEARCRMIRAAADELIASVPDPRDDYEVEKAVYRWLIGHCEYLVAGDDSTEYADAPFLGKAQCSGYAQAMALLLRTMGIPCICVPSVSDGEHEWNMTQIGGVWYNCDVTWDDQGYEPGCGRDQLHCYLNLPDRLMTDISHTQDQDGFSRPACDSIDANFVYREGIYLSASVADPAGRASAELQMAWLSGQRSFMIMVDNGIPASGLDAIREKISIPANRWIYSYIDEPRCIFIDCEDQSGQAIPEAGDQIAVHFIDVGQGDAILVQCGGESLLVDAGPAEAGEKVNSYLKSILETNALDYVIATHEHDDHIAGMPSALAGLSVGRVFSSPAIPMTWWFEKVLPGMDQDSLTVQKPSPMETFMLGGATVCFINPVQTAENPNDLSLAVRIDAGESSVLLTADIETEAEQQMLENRIPLKAGLLKVAHHGGNSSSSEAFIREVSPKVAVISVGAGNKHGHPHAEPLRCLEKYGAEIYRTDELGTIVCRSDGPDWKVEIKK